MVTNKKVVFITGGTRGIGKQTARIFAKAGYQLALNYHQNKKQAETFQEELMATYHVPVRLYQGNIGSEEEVKQMVQSIYEDFFKLDILILNAGPFIHENIKVKDYTTAQWRQMMTTNLDSFFYLIREILPHMENRIGDGWWLLAMIKLNGYPVGPKEGRIVLLKQVWLHL